MTAFSRRDPTLEQGQDLIPEGEILNPEGTVGVEPMKVNPHPPTLGGKTVVLRANGKHNSDHFLERVAELLAGEVKGIKIIKTWEAAPETFRSSQDPEFSRNFAAKIATFKPDLVIASHAD